MALIAHLALVEEGEGSEVVFGLAEVGVGAGPGLHQVAVCEAGVVEVLVLQYHQSPTAAGRRNRDTDLDRLHERLECSPAETMHPATLVDWIIKTI